METCRDFCWVPWVQILEKSEQHRTTLNHPTNSFQHKGTSLVLSWARCTVELAQYLFCRINYCLSFGMWACLQCGILKKMFFLSDIEGLAFELAIHWKQTANTLHCPSTFTLLMPKFSPKNFVFTEAMRCLERFTWGKYIATQMQGY